MSVRTSRRPLFAGAVALLALAPVRAVVAGVTLVDQERSVRATATRGPFAPNPDVVRSATGFGAFDETARNSVVDPADGDRSSASAAQRSDLTADRLRASGRVTSEELSALAAGRSTFRAVFDVAAPQPYTLSYDLASVVTGSTKSPQVVVGTVDLRPVDPAGPPAGGPAPVVYPALRPGGAGSVASFDGGGTLQPGRYELVLEAAGGNGFSDVRTRVDYTVELAFANGNGGNGNPPAGVPLPPAVWAGLITMGGMAAVRYRRRRRAAVRA